MQLYHNSALALRPAAEYPWRGDVLMEVNSARETGLTLFLRIAAWTRHATLKVTGVETPQNPTLGEYLTAWPARNRHARGAAPGRAARGGKLGESTYSLPVKGFGAR